MQFLKEPTAEKEPWKYEDSSHRSLSLCTWSSGQVGVIFAIVQMILKVIFCMNISLVLSKKFFKTVLFELILGQVTYFQCFFCV